MKIVFALSLIIVITISTLPRGPTADYSLHYTPQSYLLNKLETHDILFLGTRHKKPPILKFVSDLITTLHDTGVTHIGLEIASDQQGKIDRYLKSGLGMDQISVHPQIDSPEHRNLFNVMRDLNPNKIPMPEALDLAESKSGSKISRDEWMGDMYSQYIPESS